MVPVVQEQMLTNDQEQERNQRDAASCRSHKRSSCAVAWDLDAADDTLLESLNDSVGMN